MTPLQDLGTRSTFYLLGCERCGRFGEPPKPLHVEGAAPPVDPLRCAECSEVLLLVECWLADETRLWQSKPGAVWQHVAFADSLPSKARRQISGGTVIA